MRPQKRSRRRSGRRHGTISARDSSATCSVALVPAADAPSTLVAVAFLPAFDDGDIVCSEAVLVVGLVAGSRTVFLVRLRDPVTSARSRSRRTRHAQGWPTSGGFMTICSPARSMISSASSSNGPRSETAKSSSSYMKKPARRSHRLKRAAHALRHWVGSPTWIRTTNTAVNSRVLYR